MFVSSRWLSNIAQYRKDIFKTRAYTLQKRHLKYMVKGFKIFVSTAGLLSTDGKTKSFDNNAEGYAFSESIVAIFLQKPQDAKRIYAEVINVKSLHGPGTDVNSYLFPNSDYQAAVMKQALDESGLSPKDVSFIEADGQGIKEADANEARAIDSVFNRNPDFPLLIGSVKSNIGCTSASSTLDSVIKVSLLFQSVELFFIYS